MSPDVTNELLRANAEKAAIDQSLENFKREYANELLRMDRNAFIMGMNQKIKVPFWMKVKLRIRNFFKRLNYALAGKSDSAE